MNITGTISINLANETEFRHLFEEYYVPLCVFANRYVEDEEVAADIVQDCFVKIWQIRFDFSYLHQVRSYLYTSVRNRAINVLEHSKVADGYAERVIAKSKEAFFHDHIIEEETYRILISAIDELPRQMRTIIYHALEGSSNAEIADRMEVSVETVRSLKKIAYRKLRVALKEYYYLLLFFLN